MSKRRVTTLVDADFMPYSTVPPNVNTLFVCEPREQHGAPRNKTRGVSGVGGARSLPSPHSLAESWPSKTRVDKDRKQNVLLR
jgi:hypothetical protein